MSDRCQFFLKCLKIGDVSAQVDSYSGCLSSDNLLFCFPSSLSGSLLYLRQLPDSWRLIQVIIHRFLLECCINSSWFLGFSSGPGSDV